MQLTDLINNIHVIQVAGDVQRKEISNIVYDSREVTKNSVFVAIKGYSTDGHKFILDAINKGADAIILEDDNVVPEEIFIHRNVTKILVKNSRIALAELSKGFFKDPSSKIVLAGVTGTNGKTTTTFLVKNIFDSLGVKAGLIGTIANYIGDEKIVSKLTTPESIEINKYLSEMINKDCRYCAMEVSSHSLSLNRTYGLNFKFAVFTNITIDHLDFHKTFDNYKNSKKMLFDQLSEDSIAIINSDDENSEFMINNCKGKVIRFGKKPDSDYLISNVEFNLQETSYNLTHNGEIYQINIPLIGEFNAFNSTAALIVCHQSGFYLEEIIEVLKNVNQVPGRFEVIGKGNKKVIIDYAHTPDSLEKSIISLRKIIGDNKLITVFGCGGDRDKTKRPIMGKIATDLSDKVIITSDNPRTENPYSIIDDIVKGIIKSNYLIIEDREEAIKKAIELGDNNAAILIAGKGHETYQIINETKLDFSDSKTARKYLGE